MHWRHRIQLFLIASSCLWIFFINSNLRVNLTTFKLSTGSVYLSTINFSDLSVNLPTVKTSTQSVNRPTIKNSNPGVNLLTIKPSNLGVNLPIRKPSTPGVNLPIIKPSTPGINLPIIKASIPGVKLPTTKSSTPGANVPTIKSSTPRVNLQTIKSLTPSVNLPIIKPLTPGVNFSTINPSTPGVNLPMIKSSTPSVNLTMIKSSTPSVNLPMIKSSTPSVNLPIIRPLIRNVSLPTIKSSTPYTICPIFIGRLGNHMFIFASSYAIAKSKGMRVEMEKDSYLMKMFDLDVDLAHNQSDCKLQKYRIILEHKAAAYDKRILNFTPTKSVQLRNFLQSWMYFDQHTADIRKQFTFKSSIKQIASKIINGFLLKNNVTNRNKVTLVGVHIRRGDRVDLSKNDGGGFKVATKEYLHQAVKWYQDRFKNLMFVVGSNGIEWAKENMPKNITVMFLENNTPSDDMATLSMCDQFISTIGTFGWWCGWLTGGNVTYYKWPAIDGGSFRQAYSETYMDHYYPHWIGL